MKRNTPVFGIVILIIGVLVLLDTFDLFEVGFWFWASLCLIVPCFIGLFNSQRRKFKYLVGIAIGLMMLLYNFNIIRGSMFFPTCVAVCLILAGIKTITNVGSGNDKNNRSNSTDNQNTNYTYGYTQDVWNNEHTVDIWTLPGADNNGSSFEPNGNGFEQNRNGADNNGSSFEPNGNGFETDGGYVNNDRESGNGTYYFGDAEIIPPQGIGENDLNAEQTTEKPTDNTKSGSENGWFAGAEATYDSERQNVGQQNEQRHYQYHEDNSQKTYNRPENDSEYRFYNIKMDGREIVYRNEPFHGVGIKTVCGSITLNLRDAIITKDVNIDINASLSGIEILVPRNINVVVISNPVLGGIDNNTVAPPPGNTFPTIYIKAECSLSGVDINY